MGLEYLFGDAETVTFKIMIWDSSPKASSIDNPLERH